MGMNAKREQGVSRLAAAAGLHLPVTACLTVAAGLPRLTVPALLQPGLATCLATTLPIVTTFTILPRLTIRETTFYLQRLSEILTLHHRGGNGIALCRRGQDFCEPL